MSRRLLQRVEPADLWPLLGFALSVAFVQGLEQLPFFAAWIPATGTWALLVLYGAVLLVSAACLPIEIGSAPRAYALVYRSVLLVLPTTSGRIPGPSPSSPSSTSARSSVLYRDSRDIHVREGRQPPR